MPRFPTRRRASAALTATLAAALLTATVVTAPSANASTLPPPDNWPRFIYQGEITDKDEMDYNPTDEYIFPSIFHAGEYLDDPLGEWYLYHAPHEDPGGIVLMYSDSPEGPWTEYSNNPIVSNVWDDHYDVSHVSSPEAIWNAEAGEVFLYFHGENSVTRYAQSTDGVDFAYGDRVVWNEMGGPEVTESSYARVFEHPDESSEFNYGMFYMANEEDDIRRIRLAESFDGVNWTVDPEYVVVPGHVEGQNVSSANLWEWDGQLYVIYHASSGNSYARTIDESLRDVGTVPILLHQSSGKGDDEGRVAAPEILTHEGETYLFYEAGHRLGATIAWAKHDPDAPPIEPDPPFGDFPIDEDNPLFAYCAAEGTDEFHSDLDPDVWDRVVREPDARHEVRDDALHIPTYGSGVAGAPLLQQELPKGEWQVTTQLTIDPTETFQQGGLLLYASDTHYAKFNLAQTTPGRNIELVYHQDGDNRNDVQPPAVPGASEVWLRLTSDSEEIRASISYDEGGHFFSFGEPIDVAEAGFTHIGPFAMRGDTEAPEIEARFDWFRFSPTTDEYEACVESGNPCRPGR